MSNVEFDVKLGFDDVLLKPKRSTLTSRSKVNLTRIHKFKHSTKTFEKYQAKCLQYTPQ